MMLHQNITPAVSATVAHTQKIPASMPTCTVTPLSVGFRAAGVLGGVVGRWRNRGYKLIKVHDVGEEGVLRRGAFRID